MNANTESKNGVNVSIEKYKDHPIIKMINENVSFESRFSFKEIRESDIQKEVSNTNSKKSGTFGNIPTKVLNYSSNICNSMLQEIWNYEMSGKKYFHKNSKLADITPLYKKKDPTLVESYRPVSVIPGVSKSLKKNSETIFKFY